jgi:3-isopropylmalate/(R)-2-methylmalate dehydratase small subunit
MGPYAFDAWRYTLDGKENPDFILNKPAYRNAKIILAGDNFACGSSREAAVWSLWDFGIRCVIAPSFGDIFFNNCFQNGMLPWSCRWIERRRRGRGEPGAGRIRPTRENARHADGRKIPFGLDEIRRKALLHGQDHIAQTLQHEADIAAFQKKDRERFPWIYARG